MLGTENKDPRISYSFEGRVQTHSGKIDAFETEMIPLFWIDASAVMQNVGENMKLDASNDVAWNLVSNQGGIS